MIVRRGRITALPVTDVIIRAVEAIAEADGQKGLRFRTADGHIPFDPRLPLFIHTALALLVHRTNSNNKK